jgi:hypothetical protein
MVSYYFQLFILSFMLNPSIKDANIWARPLQQQQYPVYTIAKDEENPFTGL